MLAVGPHLMQNTRFYSYKRGQVSESFVSGTCPLLTVPQLLLFLVLVTLHFGFIPQSTEPVTRVSEWLYRGCQPETAAFADLKKKGIRTVINFRYEPKKIEQERREAAVFGLKYVSLPWNIKDD